MHLPFWICQRSSLVMTRLAEFLIEVRAETVLEDDVEHAGGG
jgi:hypothetical protein